MSLEIQIHNIQKTFGDLTALKNVNDLFQSGQLHGLIGPEGAGKTTLLRNIMGLLTPNSGNITFIEDGRSISFTEIKNKCHICHKDKAFIQTYRLRSI